MFSSHEAWQKEKGVLEYYKKTNPKFLTLKALQEQEILSRIGIKIPFYFRPKGYIRFYPGDFIVEEISKTGEASEITPKEKEIPSPLYSSFHLGCDLIKVGISTLDAINILANTLDIKLGRITYAGLKDDNALASQKLIFLDLNSEIFEKIKNLSSPYFFLTNFKVEKKKLLLGDIFGNRFTIFIRTKDRVDKNIFFQNLERIKNNGFLNFYSTQRFGVPRFLSHFLGKLIVQGKYKQVVFNFLFKTGLQETPLIKEKREKAKRFFRNWEKIEEIFSELPFTFRSELQILSYLKENPKNFIGALNFLREQTQIWVYSYVSYLFNRTLSFENKNLRLPNELPLLLSYDKRDQKIYEFLLEKDNTQDFLKNLEPFKFLRLKRRFIKTRIFPKKVLAKVLPEGVALSFVLEKGVYATTFLMNLFEFSEGLPVPEWIKTKEYDTKKLLGLGSLEAVKEIFGKNISSPLVLF